MGKMATFNFGRGIGLENNKEKSLFPTINIQSFKSSQPKERTKGSII